MKVLKFGGTSLGSAHRIKKVVELILSYKGKVIVVFSAMSGVTNSLSNICDLLGRANLEEAKLELDKLFGKYRMEVDALYGKKQFADKAMHFIENIFLSIESKFNNSFGTKEAKEIMAQGEIISSKMVFYYFQDIGKNIVLLDAMDIITLDFSGEASLDSIKKNLEKKISDNNHNIYITQGYICRDFYGNIDNLKRGGSDYTASLIGSAIKSEVIEIWTDIDGFHNNDPRYVKGTVSVEELSFDEAAELSYFGAKILHPSTIVPAKKENIPVVLKNTLAPEKKGSIIKNQAAKYIKSVAAKDGISVIRIESSRMLLAYGFLSKIFDTFNKYKTSIDMIVTSEVSVSVSIDDKSNLEGIIKDLENIGNIEVDDNKTIISIVGDSIIHDDRAADIFKIIGKDIDIRMISYGGSKNNISILVNTADKSKCLNLIHNYLF